MELFSLVLPHGLVVLLFVGLGAHALDPLELVEAENGSVLRSEGSSLLLCVSLVAKGHSRAL